MRGFEYLAICRRFDSVSSIPIKTKKQRVKVRSYILKHLENRKRVRCFKDSPGFLLIATRYP